MQLMDRRGGPPSWLKALICGGGLAFVASLVVLLAEPSMLTLGVWIASTAFLVYLWWLTKDTNEKAWGRYGKKGQDR